MTKRQFTLHDLGWDEKFLADFEALGNSSLIPARVEIEHNHLFRLLSEQGELLARTAGRMRYLAQTQAELPAVGDWVAVNLIDGAQHATIKSILPRHSCFARQAIGEPTTQQVIAANIDIVFIVAGLDADFNPRRIGRYLVAAEQSGATPIVVLNKSDLREDLSQCILEVQKISGDVTIHTNSCQTATGIKQLGSYLNTGRTIALLGSSGVGKSSIINCLLGEQRQRTREVRISDSRGRHTTIHRELIVASTGGIIIDTPGMREFTAWSIDHAVERAFEDIDLLATDCRFRDCAHQTEPGCNVRKAMDNGQLSRERLAQYHRMTEEQVNLELRKAERNILSERKNERATGRSRPPSGRLT